MNVSCALVVLLPAPHIGGTQISTLDQLFLCKPTDGLLTQETNTLTKDWNNYVKLLLISRD